MIFWRNLRQKVNRSILKFCFPNELITMAEKFSEKKTVHSNLSPSLGVSSKILKELTLKVMDLKNISMKPMMRIVFNVFEFFDIKNIKTSLFLKECMYSRCSEDSLRWEVIFSGRFEEWSETRVHGM